MSIYSTSRSVLTVVLALAFAGAAVGQDLEDEIFYHFMPIAWRDSDNDTYRYGDFVGMTASLDYLEYLGITAVWMNPIFPSPAYHGYQHGSADQLNYLFGDEADFTNFVLQAHARGIKVFLDFVVYGINQDSIWFEDAYGNPGSLYDDWLAFDDYYNTSYLGSNYTTWNGDSVGFIHWNLNNSDPVNLVTNWAQYWLDPNSDGDFTDGVDGYRLDHVWYEYETGPNGWGYNINDFWVPWKQALQSVNPDVVTFAEQRDWGSYGVELLPAFDATMTKPFEFSARDALENEYAAPLYTQMAATCAALPEGKTYVGIIGDHDVDRLSSVIGDDFDKARAAAAVLLTQPFSPIIYFGDEIGMLGYRTSSCGTDSNDIPVREPFKWNAVSGYPMSNYIAEDQCSLVPYSQDNDGRSVEEQIGVAGSPLENYRYLIQLRKDNVALRRGSYHPILNNREPVWAFLRKHDEQTLIVVINLSDRALYVDLDMSEFSLSAGSTSPVNIVTGVVYPAITEENKGAYRVGVASYGYFIAEVDLEPPVIPVQWDADGLGISQDFGPPYLVATQNNATGFGDNESEINQLFIRPQVSTLEIGITGNLEMNYTGLVMLFDTRAGGQSTLSLGGFSPPPGGPEYLTGLQFDAGFEPDYMLFVNGSGSTYWVDQLELVTTGGALKTYRGSGAVNSGLGLLNGGTNPYGMELALNNTNIAGVTDVDASLASTATTGVEAKIPYADISVNVESVTTIGFAVYLMRSDGEISNQWLPGLGGEYDNLGIAPINLNAIEGEQYASIVLDRPFGDWDGDGVFTSADHYFFAECLGGPGVLSSEPGCYIFDSDLDLDVDLADFAALRP